MTFGEIYTRVCFLIWGNSVVPAGTAATLQGSGGMIADVHQKIQQERNYWFMEASSTISLVDGTANYALPTDFKELMKSGLRTRDVTTLDYYPPLSPMYPGEYDNTHRDSDYEAPYPQYFEVRANELYLYPTPNQASTLYMWYYKFLPRPVTAVFDTSTDSLTEYGYEAICYLTAANMCKILQEYTKAQVFMQDGMAALDTLMRIDISRRRSYVDSVRYVGL